MQYKVNPMSMAPDKTLINDRGFSQMYLRWLFNDSNSPVTMCSAGHTYKQTGGEHVAHYHTHAEEIIVMLKGRSEQRVGDEFFEIGPGDCVFIPKGVVHSQKCISNEPVETIFIYIGATSIENSGYVIGEK